MYSGKERNREEVVVAYFDVFDWRVKEGLPLKFEAAYSENHRM
jgi:hypothetical protein